MENLRVGSVSNKAINVTLEVKEKPVPPIPPSVVRNQPPPSIEMREALRGTESQRKTEVKGINIVLTNLNDITVTFVGAFDGRLIKGVIRSIEKQYRSLKYTAMRECIATQQKLEKEKEKGAAK